MSAPALALANVEVGSGRRPRLRIRALEVATGEIVGVVGPNGAGKSTLLRTCLGLTPTRAGTVRVLSQSLDTLSSWARARLRRRIGYVPQELAAHGLLPVTVREVVAIGRTGRAGLLRPLRAADWACVERWLARLGLAELAGRTYGELSGGEQRKVLLARAMVQEPELLLLDEPAAYLDLGWREQIVAALAALYAESRPTIVLVSHELEALPPACGRLVLLSEGELVADGRPEDVLTPARLAALYGPGLRAWHAGGRHGVVPAAGAC